MKLLHSERLTFREYRDSDVETLIQLLNDKKVSKWTERIPFPYKKKHAECDTYCKTSFSCHNS